MGFVLVFVKCTFERRPVPLPLGEKGLCKVSQCGNATPRARWRPGPPPPTTGTSSSAVPPGIPSSGESDHWHFLLHISCPSLPAHRFSLHNSLSVICWLPPGFSSQPSHLPLPPLPGAPGGSQSRAVTQGWRLLLPRLHQALPAALAAAQLLPLLLGLHLKRCSSGSHLLSSCQPLVWLLFTGTPASSF